MNGILGKNRGLIQDIGKKWDQWAWSDLFNKQQSLEDDDLIITNDTNSTSMDGCRINYWNYNKRLFGRVMRVFGETASNTRETPDHTLIQRMMEQPVILSPIMAAKTVGTPSLSPFTLPANDAMHKTTATLSTINNSDINNEDYARANNSTSIIATRTMNAGDSLQDFIARNFAIHPSATKELSELTDAAHQQQDTLTLMHTDSHNNNETNNNLITANMDDVTTIEGQQKPMIIEEDGAASSAALPQELPQPLQAENLDDFGLSYGMEGFSTNHRDWDNGLDNDLGDFDFDVTEADFDFFESSGDDNKKGMMTNNSNNAALAAQLTNATCSILPMENVIQHTAEENPLGLSAPPMIKQEDVSMVDDLSQPPQQQPSVPDISTVSQQEEQQLTETDDTKIVSMATGISNNSPVPSDVTVVGSSDAGASTAVPATFDTSIYTMTPESSRSPTLVMTKSEYTTEHQYLVPRDFAPVSFIAGVDNTKYLEGGKFTYMNDDDNGNNDNDDDDEKKKLSIVKAGANQQYRSHHRRRIDYNIYRPDYIPRKLMKSRRKAARLLRGKDRIVPIEITHSSDSDITSSSSSDDEENDDATTTSSSSVSISSREEEDDDTDPVDRLMSAQMTYVRRLLGDIRNRPKRHRIANVMLDYDSPFGGIIVDSIHPEKLNLNDMASIDHLCQQTVWGGYPFTGMLPDSMSSGSDGTYHDEAAEAIVARQTELIQSIRGGNKKYYAFLLSSYLEGLR